MAILDNQELRTSPTNLNREDLLQQISDVSLIPMPFQDLIGRSSHTNALFEWPADRLPDPDTTNALADGASASTPVVSPANRLFNRSQISEYTTQVSTRADAGSNAGNEGLARQIQKYTRALQRDMEAILLNNQSSLVDGGDQSTAGKTAGLEAWLDLTSVDDSTTKSPATAIFAGSGTIDINGWSQRTGSPNEIPAVGYGSVSALGALTFSDIKDCIDGLYQLGAEPSKLMARPTVIRLLSSFMFADTAQIATLRRNEQGMGQGTAMSSVNTLISDYGITVDFIPNRLMQQTDSSAGTPPTSDTVFIFDPSMLALSTIGGGIRTKELDSGGLSRKVQIHCDYGLLVKNPDCLGGIVGVDDSAAVTA